MNAYYLHNSEVFLFYDAEYSKYTKCFVYFSWNEIGINDLPAMIDYVLRVTGQQQLFYIGHSQGTTAFFVMASERPEYNSRIRLMAALAPIAYMSNLTNPFLQVVSLFQNTLEVLQMFCDYIRRFV